MPMLAGKPITQNGLGLMHDVTPDEKAFKILKAALAAGVNVWNGADFCGTPDNNSLHLMNRYFTAYPEDAEKVVLSIKMRSFVDRANKILDGKKKIDIFGCARVDKSVPIEETVGALAGRAAKVTQIDMVEAEISLWATDVFENDVSETCAQLGIIMIAHTPLGAGMLTGQIKSLDDMPANDYHRFFPTFSA
ncbi:aldo/keto reductase [Penicillium pulvis]|uniref:aldo/keto reductase n=1 Tax=Penicillium pulvis TaxID=1562058 RepID=UPI0025492D02|nr:aldo/keto reductase [Penicillium pulvis]KAJ5784492.1 aldo/keto reductase [Penicillium pulvis]